MSWPSQTPETQTTQIQQWTTPPTPEELRAAKIREWKEADTNQKAWREIELRLRAELVAECFQSIIDTGTQHYPLGSGWKLSVTKTLDYKLDADKTDAILEQFSDDTAALLVKWKPELSVSNFKKLSVEDQAKFAGVLTTKPGSPQLKLVEPK